MSVSASSPTRSGSAWAPLAAPVFRALWIAQFVSNIGTWMQTVGAQWLLLGHGATLVTLVQTASSLPIVLLALPSGVLADRFDRRALLLAAQFAMLAVSAALTVLAFADALSPAPLLALTFLLGCGSALMGPAWQAIQPELVERDQLGQASALGAVNMNLARVVGPALGGVLVAAAGAGWVFAFNALSFLGIAAVLLLWRRTKTAVPAAERERFLTALYAGRRYVWNAPGIRRVLLRTALFIPGAAALWSLLPLVAADSLGLGSGGYGMLLAAVGIGAVAGAFALPRLAPPVARDEAAGRAHGGGGDDALDAVHGEVHRRSRGAVEQEQEPQRAGLGQEGLDLRLLRDARAGDERDSRAGIGGDVLLRAVEDGAGRGRVHRTLLRLPHPLGGYVEARPQAAHYESERLHVLEPGAALKLGPELLDGFPVGYRHLAYLQSKAGFTVEDGLPGLQGEAVERLYRLGEAWLRGAESPFPASRIAG